MYDQILFPTDGSEGAAAVSDHVFDLAETHGATLHVINVADTTHDSVTRIEGQIVDVLEREGEKLVQETAARAEERNLETVTDVLQGGVAETITAYAAKYDIDLVVMPTHGRTGIERLLLGSVTENVMRHSSVPVLTLDPDDLADVQYPYRNILVPTDGSESADAALQAGIDTAAIHDTTVHVFSVVDTASLGVDVYSTAQVDMLEEQATEEVARGGKLAEDASVEAVEAVEHSATIHRSICEYAEDNGVDLIVMGTRGRTGVERYLLGSVAEKTVRTAGVPVMTVAASEAEE